MSARCLRRLVLVMLLGALLLPSAATAAPPAHWANTYADVLAAKLDWPVPTDLGAPIPVTEWNRLVARMAGVSAGDADPVANARQSWVWMYTGGMARGAQVLRRENAIGGLMKLTSLLYQEKSFTADWRLLDAYADGATVAREQQVLVAGAVQLGFVTGYPDGNLYPQRPLTYGEAFALLARIIDRYEAAFPLPAAPPDKNSHREPVTLKQGAGMRGLLVFAVPAGTSGMWIECDTTLGHAPGKPGWNGVSRVQLGDLPGM